MSLALYRKYRPRTFAEVIGQEHVTEPLSQALRSGRLHHAYLFSGPRGCGKTSSARILARSLNCEQGPTPEPCGVCASCRSLANDGGGSIDVIEIDAASHGGVDDARDLREKAFFAPASSRYKIYVIDEAHMVSPAGFNALLKLVEEPPDYVKFIFATTEPEKVLGTIRSRTHHYPFRLIPPAVLRPYLQQLTEAEGVAVEPAVFPLVVRAGGGSARDSLSVLDQLIAGAGPDGVSYARAVALLGVTDVTLLDDMCDALAAGDGASAFATIDRVAEAGHDPRRFASDLLERFRDLIILQQVPDAVTKGLIDGPADQLEAMAAQATRLGPATLSRSADIVHNGLVDMRGTTAPRLLLELITARMLLPAADGSTGALLQRLERMERRLTLTTDDSVRGELPPSATEPRADAAPSAAPPASEGSAGRGGLSAARAAAAAASRRGTGPAPAGARPGHPAAEPSGPASAPASNALSPAGASAVGEDDSAVPGPAALDASAPPDGDGRPGTFATSATASRPVSGGSVPDGPYYDDEPPWDDEPEPDFEPAPAPRAAAPERGDSAPRAQGATPSVPPQPARRGEPAGVLPDAPEEPGVAAVNAGVPGALDVTAVREVWPEIITAIGRQSKKVAALASGATVRDLDGNTVVLTFRFPAHAKLVAPEAPMISNALYEALGGRWQVRCEVAGEGGAIVAAPTPPTPNRAAPTSTAPTSGAPASTAPTSGAPASTAPASTAPASGAPGSTAPTSGAPTPGAPTSAGPVQGGSVEGGASQGGPSQGGRSQGDRGSAPGNGPGSRNEPARGIGWRAQVSAPAGGQQAIRASERAPQSRRRTEDTPPPSDDDWPEPAQPGGVGSPGSAPVAAEELPEEEDGWPEVRQIGGSAPDAIDAGGAAAAAGASIEAQAAGRGRPGSVGSGPTVPPIAGSDLAVPSIAGSVPAVRSIADVGPAVPSIARTEPEQTLSGGGVNGRPHASTGSEGAGSEPSPGVGPRVPASVGPEASAGSSGPGSRVSAGSATAQPSAPVGAGSQVSGGAGSPGSAGPVGAVSAGSAGSVGAGSRVTAGSAGGLAAARAAAAAAANARATGVRPAAKPAPGNGAWSDGSATEEAPYDPEFDGSGVGAPAGYEGFDPGDEPLDDVIDEKTARESSEQQAMRLLQEAFGAEKIGEN